jgi:Arc/MetJ-type ribon-helix-helix transcriptional regulator
MKARLSISIEEELVSKIFELMRKENIFRNKSHVVEYALQELMKRKER